jgi:hypothetical protein
MTFAEVPIGHIFRVGCPCICRRKSTTSFVYVQRCKDHGVRGKELEQGNHFMGWQVRYDPLAAILEAQEGMV